MSAGRTPLGLRWDTERASEAWCHHSSGEPRYSRGVASRPASEPESAGGDARAEGEDAQWIRSFLRTQPGKTYRIDATDDAHEQAAREALAVAARTLTDKVVRDAQDPVTDHTPTPGQPDQG